VERVDILPKNYAILDLLSAAPPLTSQPSSVGPLMCGVCDDVDVQVAIHYCVECMKYMCAACSKYHSRFDATRNHKVIGAEDAKKNPKAISKVNCSSHNQPFAYFDTHCQRVVCRDCLHLDHFGHKCQSLSEADVECRKQIESLLVKVNEKKKSMQTAEEDVSHVHEELKTRQQHLSRIIDETFAQVFPFTISLSFLTISL